MRAIHHFLHRYGCRIGSHDWMICQRATEDWTDPFKEMVICTRCGTSRRYFMSDEKYISTVAAIGIVVGLSLIMGAAVKGCEQVTKENIETKLFQHKKDMIEAERGIKIMVPVYIHGTNANALDQ